MIKKRCLKCKIKTGVYLGMNCKHCLKHFCIACLMPETHKCENARHSPIEKLPDCKPSKFIKL